MCEPFSSSSLSCIYAISIEDLLLGSSPRLYREISLSLAHIVMVVMYISGSSTTFVI